MVIPWYDLELENPGPDITLSFPRDLGAEEAAWADVWTAWAAARS